MSMTKEQEVIKYFKNYTIYTKQLSEDEKRVNGQSIYQKDMEKRAKYFETVLSMLKEKDKEIKTLTQTNKSCKGMIRKKDRQINYMANFINDNTPYTKDTKELENEEGIRTANFTTKYFERKSK